MAALAWGALSFGAVYTWAYWPLAGVSAALGAAATVRTSAWRSRRWRRLALAFGVVALAIAAQLVALPAAWLERLSPARDAFFEAYAIGYHPASVHPLSIDGGSTAVALVLFVALSAWLLGLVAGMRHLRPAWVVAQLMALGVALAVVGIVQKALVDPADPLVYGFWKPRMGRGSNLFGPFINRNHFAGWMLMSVPLVIGYAMAAFGSSRPPHGGRAGEWLRWIGRGEAGRFVIVAFAVLVMGMSLALTGSRSGVVSFAAGLAAFGWLARRRIASRRARRGLAAALAVVGVAAVAWAGAGQTVQRFVLAGADAPGRVRAWQDTAAIIRDFPLAGTGIGTYGQAMMVYQTAERPRMFAHAHNEYLQIAAEGGLLVGVPAAALVAYLVASVRRRLRPGGDDPETGWIRVGAAAGLVAVATQSLLEFSLQLPGNAVLFMFLLAVALHRPAPAGAKAG